MITMKRWYSVELEPKYAEEFRRFLQDKRITYDSSGCYNLVHFEVYIYPSDIEECQTVIDGILSEGVYHG